MICPETAAREAYEMQRAVILRRATDLRQRPEAERAYPAWEALPEKMRAQFVALTRADLGDDSSIFDRFFVGAARMTSNFLAELTPTLVAEHPAPPPPRPEAA